MTDPKALLKEAAALARALGRPVLSWMLELERSHLEVHELRVAVVGPASAGKTSTLLDLLGPAGSGPDGVELLPTGPQPTTAHVVDVYTGFPELSIELWFGDGTRQSVGSLSRLRELLQVPDGALRRVIVQTRPAADLDSQVVLSDAPGTGAVGAEYADALLEDTLLFADLILFHVRLSRGLGPARPLLERIVELADEIGDLSKRFVPVLTDVRTPGRIEEVMSGIQEVLGFSPRPPVLVPRRGEVEALRVALQEASAAPELRTGAEGRVRSILREIVLPELRSALAKRRATDPREGLRHAREWIEKTEWTRNELRLRSLHHRRVAERRLSELVEETASATRSDLLCFLGESSRWRPDANRDECQRTLEQRLNIEFRERAESRLRDTLEALQREAEELLRPFDQHFAGAQVTESPPGLDRLQGEATRTILDLASRQFLAHLQRLGGRGGVKLGVMNLARQGASRLYSLAGRRAPADLIRTGIPNATRAIGEGLKRLARAAWLLPAILEAVRDLWKVARSKARLENLVDDRLNRWLNGSRDGNESSQQQGVRQQVRRFVAAAWQGGTDTGAGIDAQIESAATELGSLLETFRAEERAYADQAASFTTLTSRLQELAQKVS